MEGGLGQRGLGRGARRAKGAGVGGGGVGGGFHECHMWFSRGEKKRAQGPHDFIISSLRRRARRAGGVEVHRPTSEWSAGR